MNIQSQHGHGGGHAVRTHRVGIPRLFTITYDNTKVKTKNPNMLVQFKRTIMLYGVVWPGTDDHPQGGVSLSNSTSYRSMDEVREHFGNAGQYSITWLDDDNEMGGQL